MKKQFLLGLMALLLPLTSWAADDDPLKIEMTESSFVYNGDLTTAVKEAITVWYEDGDTKLENLVEGTDYEITFEPAEVKNVGSYTVNVKGAKTLSRYSTSTTFTITQRKVIGKFTLADKVEKTYGETDQSILEALINGYTPSTAEGFEELASGDTYKDLFPALKVGRYETASEGEDCGTYKVIVEGNGSTTTNYSFTLAGGGGTYSEMTIKPLELTVAVNPVTYKAEAYDAENDLKYTIKAGEKEIGTEDNSLPFGDKLAATLTAKDGATLKDASTNYTLQVALAANDDKVEEPEKQHTTKTSNYKLKAAEVNFTINQAELKITANSQNAEGWNKATFGETIEDDYSDNFDYTIVSPDTRENLTLTMKKEEGKDVKYNDKGEVIGYAIMPYVDGSAVTLTEGKNTTALTNYTIVYAETDQQEFTIESKSIENFTVTDNSEKAIYQGQNYSLEAAKDAETGKTGLVNVVDGSTTLVEGTDYTLARTTPDTEAKNAGAGVAVTVTGKGNYKGTASTDLTIQKATLTIAQRQTEEGEPVVVGKKYGQTDPNLLETCYEITGWANEAEENASELTMLRDGGSENVGSYNVYLYNGESSQDTYLGIVGETLKELDNYKFAVAEGTATKFTIVKGDKVYYHIADATKTYDATNKMPKSYKFVDASGKEVTFDVAPEVTLVEETAKNVGTYHVTATGGESNNYDLEYQPATEGGDTYTITPGTVTITFNIPAVDFNTEITEDMLNNWRDDYRSKYTNIVNVPDNGDDRGVIRSLLKLSLDEPATSGEHELTVTIADENGKMSDDAEKKLADAGYTDVKTLLNNYGYGLTDEDETATYFVINKCILKVNDVNETIVLDASNVDSEESEEEAEQSTWSVAKTIAKYNGAKIEKVTLKNLRARDEVKYKGEKWYTLVLPFKVSVRDLSNAFGYAIVNVPDANNTDSNVAKFKLTMGEIEPNTLIVFKVDETDKITDEITFTDRTIVEPVKDEEGNYVWYTDPAGVTYKGVYEDYKTKDRENEYWIHTDGTFWNGSVTLHPLSGFISYAITPAAARLSLENPDGSTTVIDAITMETVKSADGWYTTGGMKLSGEPTQKGVYINNGKKVVIK